MTQKTAAHLSIETIRKWGACGDGREWFRKRFPQGGDCCDVMLALYEDGRKDDASWLASTMLSRGPTSDFIKADVKSIVDLVSESATTGDEAHAATTGNWAHAATTGKNCIVAALGMNSHIQLGENGCGTLHWHDGSRYRAVTIYAGEGGIESGVWYHLNGDGVICESEEF